ncbi:hypothetical protein ABEB36_012939 [Hypothenemus hampei]|uniref:Capsid protein n=1 Tax=Hypothenemus hampei TaxID=57062 RepID=A0ABD1E699_HYPHA
MDTSVHPTAFTDSASPANGSRKKHRQGKASAQRRQDNFRRAKNIEADNQIMAGIFARLKIADPTAVSSLPLAKDNHPVTVPVAFNNLPTYVDRVWDTMEAIGPRSFNQVNTLENKNIFKKGMLILSEAKVCFAQRAHIDKPDEDLPSKKLYNTEELNDLNNMASILPYPLAIWLECIGNCADNRQIVTPLLAQLQGALADASGAITYSPRQMIPLLRILRTGAAPNDEVYMIALAFGTLPGIEWEEFDEPAVPPAPAPRMVRITQRCYNFWCVGELGSERIKWTDEEYRIFVKIVHTMNSRRGFNISTDLSSGHGTLAQTVQTPAWNVHSSIEWFTMSEVDDFNIKLGAAFGFSYVGNNHVQPSRFRGTYTTSYLRGEITPRRVMNAILAGQE